MKKYLYLYKVIKKDTGLMLDGFMTYDKLKSIPNIDTDYYVYAIKMKNLTDFIQVNIRKTLDKEQ